MTRANRERSTASIRLSGPATVRASCTGCPDSTSIGTASQSTSVWIVQTQYSESA